jgi:hypothetical protein
MTSGDPSADEGADGRAEGEGDGQADERRRPELGGDRCDITLDGISVANLENATAVQLVLPFDRRSGGAPGAALDECGAATARTPLTRAVLVGRDQGFSIPLLPDWGPGYLRRYR